MPGYVLIRHRRFASTVSTSTPEVDALLRRLVPAASRERDPESGRWLIYASRVQRLVDELRAHGVHVDEEGAR